ncbi:MAG: D-TA family PLP-dependent enzyme [Planctomycetes bacterium]|nr:D-TA family PLP-dependent enzyme [Planctomycetota bacterium]
MNPEYLIADTSDIYSPALVFYRALIRRNIDQTLRIIGDPSRLRPHVKTHKTREIVRMEMDCSITRHKCATIAEAEMLASCGVPDVLLAYPMVGPNQKRFAHLIARYPLTQFKVLADHPIAARSLSNTLQAHGLTASVLLDIDPGLHRTGIPFGDDALDLYRLVHSLPGLRAAGLHIYDGHNHQAQAEERARAAQETFQQVMAFRQRLESQGLPVPSVVLGGTPTFATYARIPGVECSPGTCVLQDHGYHSRYPDLDFIPAALLLTRVVSIPTSNRLTLDLGYKAVASDPPSDRRCTLLNVPGAKIVLQNEEHLVVETDQAGGFKPGDDVYAVPTHICPTCALHKQAYVIEEHRLSDLWDIFSRDRFLNC